MSHRLDAIRDGLPGSAAMARPPGGSPGRPSLLERWDARFLRAPLLILLVNTVLLLLRTWPRLTKPEVWAEDGVVVILEGPGRGQTRVIAGNSANTLTLTSAWAGPDMPGAGSKFGVVKGMTYPRPEPAVLLFTQIN